MGFSPSGGNISGASDVALSNPANKQVLTYDSSLQKWRNGNSSASTSVINVKDYGATGSGSQDDTAAITAAVAALTAGSTLYFPIGTYATTSAITISVPCYVVGEGGGFTVTSPQQADVGVVLINPTSGAGIFTVTSHAVHFRRLFFTSYGGAAAATSSQATAITFNTGDYCSVAECVFTGWYKWIWLKNCAFWVIRDNLFQLAAKYGIHIQNAANPDFGDQVMTGNMFASNSPWNADVLVRQESGGGLKIVANKFLCPGGTGAVRGLELAVADGVSTSILMVNANSFENFTQGAIRLTHSGSTYTGTFSKVNITGNQFTGGYSAGPLIHIVGLGSGIKLGDVLISSNMFDGNGTVPSSFISVTNASLVAIMSNSFSNGPIGVLIGSGATTTAVSGNSYFTVATHVSGTAFNAA